MLENERGYKATRVDKFAGQITETLGNQPYITIEGVGNLNSAKNLLDQGYSLLPYFGPHRNLLDPIIFSRVIKTHLIQARHVPWGWVISDKFTQMVNGIPPIGPLGIGSRAGKGWLESNDFAVYPIIQPYLYKGLNEEQLSLANALNKRSAKGVRKFLNGDSTTPYFPNVVTLLSPEGHRNKDTYGLIRPEPASKFFLKGIKTYALPVTLKGAQGLSTVNWVNNKRIWIAASFGEPFNYEQAENEAERYKWTRQMIEQHGWENEYAKFGVSDYLMLMLPQPEVVKDGEDPMGVYSKNNWVIT